MNTVIRIVSSVQGVIHVENPGRKKNVILFKIKKIMNAYGANGS